MYSLATTTCSILRGTTTNEYGDEIDDPDNSPVIARGIPIFLNVTNTRAYDRTSQTIRVIQSISGCVQSDTDIAAGDQLIDERNDTTYSIESVTDTLGTGYAEDLTLVLRRVL